MAERIPMFYPFVSPEAIASATDVLKSNYVGQGPKVDEFELLLSKKMENEKVVTVNSGTSALRLALSVIGLGPGDEVITQAQTSQATNTPILEQFAKPVFADVRYESLTLDPADIEHRISKNTKAIVCVDFGGYPCDLEEIRKVASDHGLSVIEDAAHSLGASYMGKKVGSITDFTAFSFQAIKHITTTDGGALTFLDTDSYEKAKRKRWYGIDRARRKPSSLGIDPDFDISEVGFKYHMNDVCAAIGIAQMKYLDQILERRAQIAKTYREELLGIDQIDLLESKDDRVSANWLFCMHVKNRNDFAKYMWEHGVEVSVVNWRNDKYTIFGGLRKDLPNTDKIYRDMIAIPLHNRLNDEDVGKVVRTVKEAVRNV